MSALKSFRDHCVVGARCFFQCEDWCPTPTLRTVTRVQTRKVAFSHPTRAGDSWLDFPRAGEIEEFKPGVFLITNDYNHKVLLYDFAEAKEEP